MYAKARLIAGSGEPGFRDGNFIQAAFKRPLGMGLSPDGRTLYVADSGNHAVRAIHLDQSNRVETVAGDGEAGNLDSLSQSAQAGRLNTPTDLAVSHDGSRLYIYDQGNQSIRALNLADSRLSTLFSLTPTAAAGGALSSTGLLLSPSQRRLAFIDPVQGQLIIGDLASGQFYCALKNPHLVESGVVLAFNDGKLRCYSAVENAVYGLSVAGTDDLDGAALDGLSPGASVSLAKKYDVPPGISGFTGMGAGPLHSGLITWDPSAVSFRLFDNSMANLSFVYDYSTTYGPPGMPQDLTRPYFIGHLNLLYDPLRFMVYVANNDSNQVSAVRDDSQVTLQQPLQFDHDFPAVKPVGVTRILLFGSSFEFFSNQEPESFPRFLTVQFEQYLNALSALRGTGKQYEVLFCLGRGRSVGAGEVAMLQDPQLIARYHPDYVLMTADEESLWWDITSPKLVESKDDIPLRTIDTEWMLKPVKERLAALGPVHRKIIDYCQKNPARCAGKVSLGPDGWPEFDESQGIASFFTDPTLNAYCMDIEGKILDLDRAMCQKSGAKLVAFLMPRKSYIAGADQGYKTAQGLDLESMLKTTFEAHGIPAVKTMESMRVIQPQLFPLWSKNDGHMLYKGQQWTALLMAMKFMDQIEGSGSPP
jgi:DNA-binding beta-propeller fold protein YncE